MTGNSRSNRPETTPLRDQVPNEAARIVSETVGGRIRSTELLPRGVMTFKCLVQTEGGDRFVVRFYPPARASVVNCEPDLLQRCRRAGIPVPVNLTDSRRGPKATLAYVVYQWIDGEMLSERLPTLGVEEQKTLARELSSRLSDLQYIEFHGFGELLTGETAPAGSWRAFVDACCRSGVEALRRHSLLSDAMMLDLSTIVAGAGPLLRWNKPQLVWGDISFDNILVDRSGHLAALIDFESCLSGDPLTTLGYCAATNWHQPFYSALCDAWPGAFEPDGQQRVLFYAILRALRLARYAHQPLPTGYPRDPLTQIFPGLVPALSTLTTRFAAGWKS